MLVAAMNPCPCGFLGDPVRVCRCTPNERRRYRNRLSGPLRDRIDLIVDVPAVPPSLLGEPPDAEPTSAIRERVVRARERQAERFGRSGGAGPEAAASLPRRKTPRVNAEMRGRVLWRHAKPDAEGKRLLTTALERLNLSARGYDRVLKLARTVADLDSSDAVRADHIAEALQYRMID